VHIILLQMGNYRKRGCKLKKNITHTKLFKIAKYFLFLLPGIFAFIAQRILVEYPRLVENVFSIRIFRWISTPIAFLVSKIPFSLTELLVFTSIPIVIILIVKFIKKILNSENKKMFFLFSIRKIGWTLSILYLVFMLLLGLNYTRMPLSVTMNIPVERRPKEDLEEICLILVNELNMARENVSEGDDGVMTLSGSINDVLKTGYLGFREVSDEYSILWIPKLRAKGVIASRYWSYTGIVGMYFPFFVEANVNIDVTEPYIPSTVLHELSHLIGIAREDEAEFISFITGINHPDPDFVYSAYLSAYHHATSALYREDRDMYSNVSSKRSEAVRRDMAANSEYWKQFEGPVKQTSTTVNNAYLQTNLQPDGVKSYGRVVDLILGYYLGTEG